MSGLSREMIIHPGETIKEVLEERGMSQLELSLRTGVSAKHISTVLNGEKNISVTFAKKLEYALGIDATFWINLQTEYDKEILEFDEFHSISKEEIEVYKDKKNIFDFLFTQKIIPVCNQIEQKILELRKYLSVSNLLSIPEIVSTGAFRAQTKVTVDPYVLFTWQKLCESYTQNISVEALPKEEQQSKLESLCQEIKKLSLLSQEVFIPKLQQIFASCGIAFSVIPSFKGAPVQGFIKTTDSDRTILCMTYRQKKADIFWFTLFHEIGHFLNGDTKQKFIDFESVENAIETRANKFAQNILIKSDDYKDFVSHKNFSLPAINTFSKKQNILPTITS